MMSIRRFAFLGLAVVASGCTAILDLSRFGDAPVVDAGPDVSSDAGEPDADAEPGMKKPVGAWNKDGSPPMTAVITSTWSMAASIARRTPGLAVGPCNVLGRRPPNVPYISTGATTTSLLLFSIDSRSGSGESSQSTDPVTKAFAAVAGSGMICHSTRSTMTRSPPDAKLILQIVSSASPILQQIDKEYAHTLSG